MFRKIQKAIAVFAVIAVVMGSVPAFAANFEETLRSARLGNIEAQYELGLMYFEGKNVRQDYEEAARWYRLSAERGFAKAQNNLGFMYEKGYGMKRNDAEAVRWYTRAAQNGNARAQCNLGYMYEKGYGVMQNYTEAARWYRLSAEQGFARAQNNLGWLYHNGYGVEQDYEEAEIWYKKAAAQGDNYAKNNLKNLNKDIYRNRPRKSGYSDNDGYGESEKLYMLRRAADRGETDAQNDLGVSYLKGVNGAKQDYKEAVKWFKMAANSGNMHAQYNLAWCYARGHGVPQSDEKATAWFRKAAYQGHKKANEILRWVEIR